MSTITQDRPRMIKIQQRLEFKASDLHKTLKTCAPMMSTEETRYYLCGACLQTNNTGMTVVATNGHGLIMRRMATRLDKRLPMECIIARKCVKDLIKWLWRLPRGASVEVVINGRTHRDIANGSTRPKGFIHAETAVVKVLDGTAEFDLKIVDGTYPDWERVLPRGDDLMEPLHFKRQAFLNALKLVQHEDETTEDDACTTTHLVSPVVKFTVPHSYAVAVNLESIVGSSVFKVTEKDFTPSRGKNKGITRKRKTNKLIDDTRTLNQATLHLIKPLTNPVELCEFGAMAYYLRDLARTCKPSFSIRANKHKGPMLIECGDDVTRMLMPCRV